MKLDPSATCGDVKSRAEVKIEDIKERIRTLQRMKQALAKLTKACSGRGKVSDCPILDALDGEEKA